MEEANKIEQYLDDIWDSFVDPIEK